MRQSSVVSSPAGHATSLRPDPGTRRSRSSRKSLSLLLRCGPTHCPSPACGEVWVRRRRRSTCPRLNVFFKRPLLPLQIHSSWMVPVPAGDFFHQPEQAPGVVEMVVSPPLGAHVESAAIDFGIEPALSVAVRSPSPRFPSPEEGEPANLEAQGVLGIVPVHQVFNAGFRRGCRQSESVIIS